MSNPVSRRSALAGVAAVALTASVPALASTDNDAALVAAWRKWNDAEDAWCVRFIESKYSGDHEAGCMPDVVEEEINATMREVEAASASTPAGYLCKLDVALHYGMNVEDSEEDYPWCVLIGLMRDLESVTGLQGRSFARKRTVRSANEEIAAREAPQRAWAEGWISNAERCGQSLAVVRYLDGRGLYMDEPASPEKCDPAFDIGRLSRSERRTVMDVLEDQGKVYFAETNQPSRVSRPVSKAEREAAEIVRRSIERQTVGA